MSQNENFLKSQKKNNITTMNHIKYIAVAATLASSLTGCGLYSNFERSVDSEIVDSLYSYVEATNDTTTIASLSWRELFTDPYLQTLIGEALENNSDLNVAQLNVDQAEVALSTSRLAFLPSLSLEPQGSITSFKGSTSKTYNISLSSSWEIDVFGKLRNAKEGAKALLEQSKAYRQAVQTELVATIASSYYTLLMLDEQLEISKQTKINWEENIRVMKALKSAGRIKETSVLQSEASCIALSTQIVTLEEQIALMENTISTLLAKPTAHIVRGSISDAEFPSELSIGLPIQLLSNRPDVRMAESNLAQAFYATNEARSSLYPSLTLSGSAGFTNSSGGIQNPGDMLYTLVGSIVQPIFSRGVLRAEVKISESQQEQALLQFNQAILDAGAEVNNALSQWQSAQARLQLEAQRIAILEKTVLNTELLMRHGSAEYLEVLTAQVTLLSTELSYSGDKFNIAQGVIDLYRALGGGEN